MKKVDEDECSSEKFREISRLEFCELFFFSLTKFLVNAGLGKVWLLDWRIGCSEIDSASNLLEVIGSETSVSIRNYYAVRNSSWSLDLL